MLFSFTKVANLTLRLTVNTYVLTQISIFKGKPLYYRKACILYWSSACSIPQVSQGVKNIMLRRQNVKVTL